MTENEKDQELIYADSRIDSLQKASDFLRGFKNPEECPGQVHIEYTGRLIITIRNLEELHLAREYLRKEWGEWEDKLGLIFACGDANANYEGEHAGSAVCIRLACPMDEFPEELTKGGCHFKKVSRTEWDFVCDRKKA